MNDTTQEGWEQRGRGRTMRRMHSFHADMARQITESRIADAERARSARHLTRARRSGRGRALARRVLQPIAHPGPALARLVRPE